jgi:site-specific recombinase XerD
MVRADPGPSTHCGAGCDGFDKKVGIVPDHNGETIVMYTTRHSYATGAIASGVSDRRLSELMGHTDPKTTQRYVHLARADLHRAAVEATASIFRQRTGA